MRLVPVCIWLNLFYYIRETATSTMKLATERKGVGEIVFIYLSIYLFIYRWSLNYSTVL